MIAHQLPQQVEPRDEEIAEEWIRNTDDEVRCVGAHRFRDGGDWPWRVVLEAAQLVREDPLERELRGAVRAALEAVKGVTRVEEEDREVWAIAGCPDGEALVRAAAAAVDGMEAQLRAYVERL